MTLYYYCVPELRISSQQQQQQQQHLPTPATAAATATATTTATVAVVTIASEASSNNLQHVCHARYEIQEASATDTPFLIIYKEVTVVPVVPVVLAVLVAEVAEVVAPAEDRGQTTDSCPQPGPSPRILASNSYSMMQQQQQEPRQQQRVASMGAALR
ncbi:hypothetical protein AWZ03_008216 [Drosophila navojoa]|uniref:Uncharacterized protein n=1 Tax=Drosophila navojoa TaxID=7232 RepID=A0A484B9G9_DRONA|nr:hypothetical protein AWZ03_008216 [Drosophila navojoa]